ncbi:MAG: hypothetical protein ACYTKD_23065 [Planctomycetota bacterium]
MARSGAAAAAGVAAIIAMILGSSGPAPRATPLDDKGTPARIDRPPLGFALARLVPPDTLAFVSIPDVPGSVGRVSATGLARALRDERVAPFVREVVAGLPREAAELHALALLFARGLGPSLRGEAAAALLNVEARAGGATLEGVFLADVSGRAAGARAFLGTTLALRFVTGRIESVKIAGADAVVCRAGTDTVAWCECDGLLAIATSPEALGEVLTEGSSLDGDVDYRVFVDVERLISLLLGERGPSFSARHGIAGLRSATLTGRVGTSVREALHLDVGDASGAPGVNAGVFRALGGSPVGLGPASRMPPETILAAFGNVDGRDLAKLLSDPRALRGAPKSLLLLLSLLGRGSARSVLEGVRGEAAVAAWNDGRVGWFPRLALVASIEDRAGTERTIEAAWRSLAARMRGRFLPRRGRWTSDPSREVTVGFVDGPEVFIPIVGSPAYGLDGDTLVAATSAMAVCRFMEEPAGLAATEGFRSLLAELPPERSAFVYVNVETLVERALEPHGLSVLEALAPGLSERFDRERLPPGEAAARHLGLAGVSAVRAGDGIRVDAVTPTGLAAALILVNAVSESSGAAGPPSQARKPAGDAGPLR